MTFEPKDILTLCIAAGGLTVAVLSLALGIANLVRSVRADQVRLRVVPMLSWPSPMGTRLGVLSVFTPAEKARLLIEERGQPAVTIEVTNIGKTTAIIDEIGFCHDHPKRDVRGLIYDAERDPDVGWPARLEPRQSVRFQVSAATMADSPRRFFRAYAGTACGEFATGTSPAFRVWCQTFGRAD